MNILKTNTIKTLRLSMIILFSAMTSISTMTFAETPKTAEKETFATPLQAVIAGNSFIDEEALSTITLSQETNRNESPDLVKITLIQSGLLDDSVESIKTVYYLSKAENGWFITDKTRFQKCRRGNNTIDFTRRNCN